MWKPNHTVVLSMEINLFSKTDGLSLRIIQRSLNINLISALLSTCIWMIPFKVGSISRLLILINTHSLYIIGQLQHDK